MASLQIHTIVSDPFEENSYICWREGNDSAIVVDPGLDPEAIRTFLATQELTLAAILCTHGHADHIAGNAAMKTAYPNAPLMIGRGDAVMLSDPDLNLSGPFGFPLTSPPADRLLEEGSAVEAAGLHLNVHDLPGHSPGHVVFRIEDGNRVIVFAGDTLMRGSIGRGDFPGGNMPQLLAGIRQVLFTLPLETIIYPGHGPVTTVGHEKATNPFLQ